MAEMLPLADEARGLWIDGQVVPSTTFTRVINPATGQAFARSPSAKAEQLDLAVAAARRAFPAWRALGFQGRREHLFAFADRLEGLAERLAPLLTREHGKPLDHARQELQAASKHIQQLSSLDMEDELLRDDARGRVELVYHPLGVVGAIAPWNFPVALSMHKVAQALYTGNTIVLKPSPFTPLTMLAIGALAGDILPPGTLNILAGGNEIGAMISAHPGIDKISFTGSVQTGKKVLASAAGTLKRVTLELGGNDAAIILEDADLDRAAAGIARSGFYNCGQICMAVKRVYAAEAIHDALVERIVERVKALKVGDGLDSGIDMGPLQNIAQYDRVLGYLNDAVARPEAKVWTGGRARRGAGYFIEPTVITGLPDGAPLVREEQFGPVLPILRFTSVDEAISRANDSRFGLGASLWSRDEDKARELGARLEAGTIWINRHGLNESDVPFGGMKESGYGREHGVIGLRAYMELQVISCPRE